jgi:hypothetical protein
MAHKNWLEIDPRGLAKLVERRGKVALVFELVSNGADADGVTRIDVLLTPEEGVPKAWLTVTDDAPDGFADLTHAYTVFAESNRKARSDKRGRFNLGEKLVLALCDEASIVSTTGAVCFDARGRHSMKARRPAGSEFMGLVRITRAELTEVLAELGKIIPPAGVTITVNRKTIPARTPIATFEATLPTEIADDEGMLRRSRRKTTINVYEPLEGETPTLYEMGIPVVETGDKWHVEVMQKIPLNMDRDNVTPAFLREVRTLVVNHMHELLTEADAATPLVREALADENATPEAVRKALDLTYGEKRAIWDPSDHEANMNLTAQGYTLIKGSQLTKDQWVNVKRHDAERTKPAGQIAPTKVALFAPGGKDSWVPREKWTAAITAVVGFTQRISQALLDRPVTVDVLSDITLHYAACFGQQGFVFNLGRLGHAWFDRYYENGRFVARVDLTKLIIHELGHHFEPNHLDERYHEALCRLGAQMANLALTQPELFGVER